MSSSTSVLKTDFEIWRCIAKYLTPDDASSLEPSAIFMGLSVALMLSRVSTVAVNVSREELADEMLSPADKHVHERSTPQQRSGQQRGVTKLVRINVADSVNSTYTTYPFVPRSVINRTRIPWNVHEEQKTDDTIADNPRTKEEYGTERLKDLEK